MKRHHCEDSNDQYIEENMDNDHPFIFVSPRAIDRLALGEIVRQRMTKQDSPDNKYVYVRPDPLLCDCVVILAAGSTVSPDDKIYECSKIALGQSSLQFDAGFSRWNDNKMTMCDFKYSTDAFELFHAIAHGVGKTVRPSLDVLVETVDMMDYLLAYDEVFHSVSKKLRPYSPMEFNSHHINTISAIAQRHPSVFGLKAILSRILLASIHDVKSEGFKCMITNLDTLKIVLEVNQMYREHSRFAKIGKVLNVPMKEMQAMMSIEEHGLIMPEMTDIFCLIMQAYDAVPKTTDNVDIIGSLVDKYFDRTSADIDRGFCLDVITHYNKWIDTLLDMFFHTTIESFKHAIKEFHIYTIPKNGHIDITCMVSGRILQIKSNDHPEGKKRIVVQNTMRMLNITSMMVSIGCHTCRMRSTLNDIAGSPFVDGDLYIDDDILKSSHPIKITLSYFEDNLH